MIVMYLKVCHTVENCELYLKKTTNWTNHMLTTTFQKKNNNSAV